MRFHVTAFALVITALLSLLPGVASADRIQCPLATYISLNWRNNIGSNPTFKVNTGTQYIEPKLVSIDWAGGQVITCNYSAFGGGVVGTYAYTVHRRIKKCSKSSDQGVPLLDCRFY